MKINKVFFKHSKILPVDKFLKNVLYDKKYGYYTSKIPFGEKGDFITSPKISDLFSEMIAIWMVASWETFGKPNNFNIIELGPGDGSLTKILLRSFKKFPKFNSIKKLYLYEESKYLKKIQKKKFKKEVKWINNFNKIKKGPVIFFGNEFFDAIPIKQFIYKNKLLLEKYCYLDRAKGFKEVYQRAKIEDIKEIKNFRVLKDLKFIEFPKLGILEMSKIVKKIKKLSGGVLLIDYGYTKPLNKSTIQMVMQNKKVRTDDFFKNVGKADITSLVNFSLLKEYFLKNEMNVKKIVTQKFFLEKMGIVERAKILEKKMDLKQKNYMLSTLNRLLNKKLMGDLFKVIFAFKSKSDNFLGFK